MSDPSKRRFCWSDRGRSFRHAFRGVRVLIATEHNAWLHLLASLLVLIAGILLGISRLEWVAVTLAIGLVLAAEAVNSALERLADAVSAEHHPLLRDAKDLAAGAVLISAATALVVGVLVFLPDLLTLFVTSGGAG